MVVEAHGRRHDPLVEGDGLPEAVPAERGDEPDAGLTAVTDQGMSRAALRVLSKLDDEGKGEVRLLPHLHGTDGFYLAALRVS